MPIYENRQNAENHLRFSPDILKNIVRGCEGGAEKICSSLSAKSVILCEAWYGTAVVEFTRILAEKLAQES